MAPGQRGAGHWFPIQRRMNMANRDDTKDQSRAADEAARTTRTVTDEAARVGEQTARAGADIVNRSTETARNVVEAGLNTATETFERATDQFTKVLGFSGPEAEQLAHRASENLQAVSQANTVPPQKPASGASLFDHKTCGPRGTGREGRARVSIDDFREARWKTTLCRSSSAGEADAG